LSWQSRLVAQLTWQNWTVAHWVFQQTLQPLLAFTVLPLLTA
jgi:hypothetical protein